MCKPVDFYKNQNAKNIAHDLDLGSGHTAYRHASLIDLYLPTYRISLKSKKLFCGQTDGRPYERTDI